VIGHRSLGQEAGFRWRSGEINRFEGLSDAIFAFAVTLLIISLEVPETFTELLHSIRGFGAFALCFALLIWIWHGQYVFFRRYALEDKATLVLNAALLFLVLFYVYPLKFLSLMLMNQVMGQGIEVHRPGGLTERMIEGGQGSRLMILYGLGFFAIFGTFALLYGHALRRRQELELDPQEILLTRSSIESHLITAGVALFSVALAAVLPEGASGWAGWAYFLLGPAHAARGFWTGRRARRLAVPPA
jgi:hypothetical protein